MGLETSLDSRLRPSLETLTLESEVTDRPMSSKISGFILIVMARALMAQCLGRPLRMKERAADYVLVVGFQRALRAAHQR